MLNESDGGSVAGGTCHAWGAGIYEGQLSSSHIETAAVQASTLSDTCSIPAPAGLSASGAITAELNSVALLFPQTREAETVFAGAGSQGKILFTDEASANNAIQSFDGVNTATNTSGSSMTSLMKVATKWAEGVLKVFKNNTIQSGPFDGSMGSGDIFLGSYDAASQSNVGLRNLKIYSTAPSDAVLQAETTE
jgi:hypothetical protein